MNGVDDTVRKGKIVAKSLGSRLTGVSSPFFGAQWTPPADQREIIRKLLIELEDRRVLFVPYCLEVIGQVTSSVMQLRRLLTQSLQDLPGGFRGHRSRARHARRLPKVPGGAASRVLQLGEVGRVGEIPER